MIIEEKKKLNNWEEGDTFALPIKSKKFPKYNGQYLILINTIIDKKEWKMTRTTKTLRAKITKNKKIPKIKQEIDKLEYIKTDYVGFLSETKIFPEETKGLYEDQYHFIYKYLLVANAQKYKLPDTLIYLGNFDLEKPKNEYIPYFQHNGILYSFWEHKYSSIVESLLYHYEIINLKKALPFGKEYQDTFYEREIERIEIASDIKQLIEDLQEPDKDKILKSRGIDPENEEITEDSETYVGNSLDFLNKKF